jgi:hypothetical protein
MPSPLVKALGAVLLVVFAVVAATGPSGAQSGYGGPGPSPKLTLKVKRQSLQTVRRSGLKVRAACDVPCTVTVGATKGGRPLGRGKKRLPNRTGTVRVKFTKKGKRAIKRRFAVRGVAVNDSNVKSEQVNKSVKLKRKKRR